MTALGDIYYYGEEVRVNIAEGFKWYEKARDLKDSQAMISLGKIALGKNKL